MTFKDHSRPSEISRFDRTHIISYYRSILVMYRFSVKARCWSKIAIFYTQKVSQSGGQFCSVVHNSYCVNILMTDHVLIAALHRNYQWRVQDFSKEGGRHRRRQGSEIWCRGLGPSMEKIIFVPKMISWVHFAAIVLPTENTDTSDSHQKPSDAHFRVKSRNGAYKIVQKLSKNPGSHQGQRSHHRPPPS